MKAGNELISVIIPTYRRSHKIEAALKSVINQTYNNLEIIVIDDNANYPEEREKTEEIVKKYIGVKLIQNKHNLGGALTRNVGINNASARIIAFLDDDDEMTTRRIEKQLDLFYKKRNDNIGVIICNKQKGELPIREDLLYAQMIKHIALTSTWLTSKDVLETVGCFEDTPSEQDAILLLKIIANGYNVCPVYEQLVIMAEHTGEETVSGSKPKNIVGLENYRKWCRRYYSKLGSKKKIKNVECQLSYRLMLLKLKNNLRKDAFRELRNIFLKKPFSNLAIKGIIKFIASSISICTRR